jgi:hypothetical protein
LGVYVIDRCRELGVNHRLILAKHPAWEYNSVRRMLIWELRVVFGASFSEIGTLFNIKSAAANQHYAKYVGDYCCWGLYDGWRGRR